MKPIAVSACLLLTLAMFVAVRAGDQSDPTVKATLANSFLAMPLAFTLNNGQWPDSILFRAGLVVLPPDSYTGVCSKAFTGRGIVTH